MILSVLLFGTGPQGCAGYGDKADGGDSDSGKSSSSGWAQLSFATFYLCGVHLDGTVSCPGGPAALGDLNFGQADPPEGEFTLGVVPALIPRGYASLCGAARAL